MDYSQDDFNLAFDTYDFYNAIVVESEEKHFTLIERYHNFLEDNMNPPQIRKTYYKKKLNKSFNNLLIIYRKQLTAMEELINIHKSNKIYFKKKKITLKAMNGLKNVTATLIEQLQVHQKQINDVLS